MTYYMLREPLKLAGRIGRDTVLSISSNELVECDPAVIAAEKRVVYAAMARFGDGSLPNSVEDACEALSALRQRKEVGGG